ncbi:hypothetical protein L486_03611 [Kwoniella mangroviensis CBS 10435]|uniref:Uncharacterized protein n=1 Tax=Kwoniella mangroviensis CBS 10435 TaxID=1331196 RepID=A0A1B9IUD0_9TREE|nr:hypothetical protein L486_03611 [Kwoniella mangroviensis CBS 10435]
MPIEPITIPLSPRTPSALLSSLILSPRPQEGISGTIIPQSLMEILSPILPSSSFPSGFDFGGTSPSNQDGAGRGIDLPDFPLPPSPSLSCSHAIRGGGRRRGVADQYRSLTFQESKQLAEILVSTFKPHKKNPKELMRVSIDLASRLDDCGIKWDKQRKVMGIHLRGLFEMGMKMRDGEGMDMYVQGSFVTTAETPHPIESNPLPIPLAQPAQNQSGCSMTKHTIQAGLLSALPINIDSSSPSRSTAGHRQTQSITSIKSILARPSSGISTLNSPGQPQSILSPSKHRRVTSLTLNHDTTFGPAMRSPTLVMPSVPASSFGQIRPGFELHEGLRADAKLLERERKIQKWRERKKRVGLRIRVDNHKSHQPLTATRSAMSHRSAYSAYSARTPRTRIGYKAFTPVGAALTARTPHTPHTRRRGTPYTAAGRRVTPRYPREFTPRRGNGTPRYPTFRQLQGEVPHQTGRFQTNLIQHQPYSAISFRIPSPPLSGMIKSAHSVTSAYKYRRKKKFGLGLGLSVNLNLKVGKKKFTFGNGKQQKVERPRSGRKMGFGGWELR